MIRKRLAKAHWATWKLLIIVLGFMLPSTLSVAQMLPNGQTVQDRIQQLQNQIRQEQQAALQDEATARQAWQQQNASSSMGSAGPAMAQMYGVLAQSAANSANAHRSRAQQLQYELNELTRHGVDGASGASLFFPTPSTAVPAGGGLSAGTWSESYLQGSLVITPDHVRYESRDRRGNLTKGSFDASCSEIKEWKGNKANFMNAFAGANPQMWDLHIKLRSGKNTNLDASTEVEMNEILQAISKACGSS
jgi:hypothetical protein